MDYLEGLFLGELWSDTDFENRRHYALFILYGLLTDVFFLIKYLTGNAILTIGNGELWKIIVYGIFFLACPFLCFRYYRMPLWGKILVLFEKIFKAVIVLDLTIKFTAPLIKVSSDGLQDYLISFLNSTLENYTEKFASGAGSFSTVMGVLAGGIHVVLVCVLVVVAAIVIPGLVFIVIRYLQKGYDFIIKQLILKRFFQYRH